MGSLATERELLDLMAETDKELQTVRQYGELVLDAFFGEDKAKQREERRKEYANLILQDFGKGSVADDGMERYWDRTVPLGD